LGFLLEACIEFKLIDARLGNERFIGYHGAGADFDLFKEFLELFSRS